MAGCAASLSMIPVSTANAAPDPNFHIYIAYGQSNMEGNATNFDKNVDGKEHPRVKMFATVSCSNLGRPTVGEMYPAVPPMFKCYQGLSVADWFGRHMADSLPDVTIGIIPVAQGGTSIRLFDPDDYKNYIASAADWLQSGVKDFGADGNAMGRIIEVAKKAQEVGVIKGIIFHQGETDGGMSNWEQIVKKTYEYMLDQLGLNAEETPFVAGEMVDGGSCAGFNSRVHKLKDYIANFSYASSKGYGSKGDGLHFTVEGYRGMGERYAQEMLKLINVEPVDPVPQEPFGGKAAAIPGKIEVENYDVSGIGSDPTTGESNKSYSDNDSENKGKSKYRDGDGVDLYDEATGVALGMTQKGEWLEYTVNVTSAGKYKVFANVASGTASSSFAISIDGKAVGSTVAVPQTADNTWDVYTDVEVGEVELTAGTHLMKFEVTGDYVNVDYFEFKDPTAATADPTTEPSTDPALNPADTTTKIGDVKFGFAETRSSYYLFDMQGKFLSSFVANGMNDAVNMVKTGAKTGKLSQGVYFVRSSKEKAVQKVVVREK